MDNSEQSNVAQLSAPKFISIKEAAARLSVSPTFIEKLLSDPENPMPSYKVGRRRLIDVVQLDTWVMSKAA